MNEGLLLLLSLLIVIVIAKAQKSTIYLQESLLMSKFATLFIEYNSKRQL